MLRGFEENHDITSCSIFYCWCTSYIHENQDQFNSQFHDLFSIMENQCALLCLKCWQRKKENEDDSHLHKRVAVALLALLRIKHSNST